MRALSPRTRSVPPVPRGPHCEPSRPRGLTASRNLTLRRRNPSHQKSLGLLVVARSAGRATTTIPSDFRVQVGEASDPRTFVASRGRKPYPGTAWLAIVYGPWAQAVPVPRPAAVRLRPVGASRTRSTPGSRSLVARGRKTKHAPRPVRAPTAHEK